MLKIRGTLINSVLSHYPDSLQTGEGALLFPGKRRGCSGEQLKHGWPIREKPIMSNPDMKVSRCPFSTQPHTALVFMLQITPSFSPFPPSQPGGLGVSLSGYTKYLRFFHNSVFCHSTNAFQRYFSFLHNLLMLTFLWCQFAL